MSHVTSCSAEFCVTNHRFRVNGQDHWINFTGAGTKWGCTYLVSTTLQAMAWHCNVVRMQPDSIRRL